MNPTPATPEKPEAIRLAEELLIRHGDDFYQVCDAASTELLYLHNELERETAVRKATQDVLASTRDSLRAMTEDRDAKQRIIETSCRDWAADDTEIKAICARYGISEQDVPGYHKNVVECVEELAKKLDALKIAASEFRECVLGGRHQLEAPCLDNDQTNAVLGLFDDLFAQPEPERSDRPCPAIPPLTTPGSNAASPPVPSAAGRRQEMDAKEFLDHIFEECRIHEGVAKCDDRKLLWLLLTTPQFKDWPMTGPVSAIRDEIENRLYPEYDGDKVSFQEWGWSTPDGEVRYV